MLFGLGPRAQLPFPLIQVRGHVAEVLVLSREALATFVTLARLRGNGFCASTRFCSMRSTGL